MARSNTPSKLQLQTLRRPEESATYLRYMKSSSFLKTTFNLALVFIILLFFAASVQCPVAKE